MAAVVLRYSDPGYIDRHGVAADDLDKQIDVLRARVNKTVLQGSMFCRRATPTGAFYKEADFGKGLELPRLSEDAAKVPMAVPVPGFDVTIYHYTYRLGIQVERALVEDSVHGTIRARMNGLLRSGRLMIEYMIANYMNNLTDATNYPGADGVALASASHPHPRRETGVWSNIDTAAALSLASFSLNRKALRQRKDEFGYVDSMAPRYLVVPSDLEQKARELKTAEFNPDTSTNQPNVWRKDAWEVFVYDYLTDTNGWALVAGGEEDEKGIILTEAVKPGIAPLDGADKSTDIIWGQRLRMRVGIGAHVWRTLQYNEGA